MVVSDFGQGCLNSVLHPCPQASQLSVGSNTALFNAYQIASRSIKSNNQVIQNLVYLSLHYGMSAYVQADRYLKLLAVRLRAAVRGLPSISMQEMAAPKQILCRICRPHSTTIQIRPAHWCIFPDPRDFIIQIPVSRTTIFFLWFLLPQQLFLWRTRANKVALIEVPSLQPHAIQSGARAVPQAPLLSSLDQTAP